jgi:alkanesulfonate monooxygenase SsuD/methylene tetrahydromethanopterin reductase-like flavin-dependent oxidoreductase (luciferase family)
MSERAFRFGVVAATAATGAEWVATARRAEELGYDTLLVPDTLRTLAPLPALAVAAASTRDLRVGTYVLSVPNRAPGLVAWESKTMHLLTGGRFELGLGGGRQGADRDAAALGGHFGTPGERLQRMADTIRAVRESGTPGPPIMVAASKPRMLRLAAEQADIVALGLPPQSTEEELARAAGTLDRGSVELHVNVVAVAESAAAVPEWVSGMVGGGDPRAMAAAGGFAFLLGTPAEIAAVLRRRRAELGISYVGVGAMFMEQLAPVVALLRDTGP